MASTKRRKKNLEYESLLFQPKHLENQTVMIGSPMTGTIRSEWALARYGQIIPCNWSQTYSIQWLRQITPMNYLVAEARNVIVDQLVKSNHEWLFFIDSDVVLPPDCFVRINEYMREKKYPVVTGIYYAKCHPPEPLIYRGRGNSFYHKWKRGDKIWVDGIPMGCTLIHRSVLEVMWRDAEEYIAGGNAKVRRVFDTPAKVFIDPSSGQWKSLAGTEDLAWCNRVIAGKYLKKSGWNNVAKKKYPFLVDTGIFCKHITPDGTTYPIGA